MDKEDDKVIADTFFKGKSIEVTKSGTSYGVTVDGLVTQPNLDADGVIRYLAHVMHMQGGNK